MKNYAFFINFLIFDFSIKKKDAFFMQCSQQWGQQAFLPVKRKCQTFLGFGRVAKKGPKMS